MTNVKYYTRTFYYTSKIAEIRVERQHLFKTVQFYFAASNCLFVSRVSGNCDKEERYRSISGVCNNIRHPEWGSINQELNRILPAAYEVRQC